jgi:hypothetical protein
MVSLILLNIHDMIKKIISSTLVFLLVTSSIVRADEGMWIPLLLQKYNIKAMQAKGFKLSADDIYSINKASLKDAVVIFGGGCTGELISDEGLLITNHHCGIGSIQRHSSLQSDYLTDGFWAMDRSKELPNERLSVTFLERMEDVTAQILSGVDEGMGEMERQKEILKQIQRIQILASEGGKYQAIVKPFFYGNEYYLFVSKIYRDVRLVGAPPSGIGKFGGDTDNWMWPRHTGDFALFRIYAGKDNEPADYSPDNIPYKPKKHFPISLKGVQKGDFTMVFGYPGRTEQYLTSFAVKMLYELRNPNRINIRNEKINIMGRHMERDAEIRIKYTSKYYSLSNAWKKWTGENLGLKRLEAIGKKEDFEKRISAWINSDEQRKQKFGSLLTDFKQVYDTYTPILLADDYFTETATLDIIRLVRGYREIGNLSEKSDIEEVKRLTARQKNGLDAFFKDYDITVDKELLAKMIELYYRKVDKSFQPDDFKLIETKFKGNTAKYTEYLYSKTMFADKLKLDKFLTNYKVADNKLLLKDPIYQFWNSFSEIWLQKIAPIKEESENKLERINRFWMQAIMQFEKEKVLYPDANFTLRVSYGNIDDYFPADGVKYLHYTTLKGIMEKDNPEIYDYRVPARLKELYEKKIMAIMPRMGKSGCVLRHLTIQQGAIRAALY